MKTDRSKKVGSSRRKAGSAAKKSSVNKGARGKPITHTRGQAGYQHRKDDD
jgi:hypothetical protein